MSTSEQTETPGLETPTSGSHEPGATAVSGLIQTLLHSDDKDAVNWAIHTLSWEFKDPQAINALAYVALKGRFGGVISRRALRGISEIGGSGAIKPLLIALTAGGLKSTAAEGLGKIGSLEAVDFLIAILDQPNEGEPVRGAAAKALGKIGSDEAIIALVAHLADDDVPQTQTIVQALKCCGHPATKYLIPLLEHIDTAVQERAIEVLGALKDPCAIPALFTVANAQKALGDIPAKAIEAIGLIGGEEAVEALLSLVNAHFEDRAVTCPSVLTLGDLGYSTAVGPLVEIMRKAVAAGDRRLILVTCFALARIGDPAAAAPLIPYLDGRVGDQWSRNDVALVLLALGDECADYALLKHFGESVDSLSVTKHLSGYLSELPIAEGLEKLFRRVSSKYAEGSREGACEDAG